MDDIRSVVPKFWLFIVVGLVTTLAFGFTAIWRSSQAPLDNAKDEFVFMQNRVIEAWIDFQLAGFTESLTYLAERPVVISTTIGETHSNKALFDVVAEFDLVQAMTHIDIVDVLGDRMATRALDPRWYGVYTQQDISRFAQQQLISATPLITNKISADQNIVMLSVPILYAGQVEGAIVANFHLDVNREEFHEIGMISALLYQPDVDTEELHTDANDIVRTLDSAGLVLKTRWDFSSLQDDKFELVWTLSKSLLFALGIAFVALGFVGQGMIVRPQKLLVASRQELLESEQRARELAEVAESANDGIVITDRAGRVIWANRSMLELTGYALDELLGRTPGEVLQGADTCQVTRKEIADALLREEGIRTDILNYSKSGAPYWIEIAITPVLDQHDNVVRFIAIERNITEQKERLELEKELQAARKLEAVGQLAAGIAHEINTPCQYVGDNIAFFSEAVDETLPALSQLQDVISQDSKDDRENMAIVRDVLKQADLEFFIEELPDSISQAKEGINRISEIVRAMKDFSHPGTDKQSIDLNRTIASCLTVSRSEWKYIAEAEVQLCEDLPAVFVSPGELNQVFVNIIVNAAHAISDRYKGETAVHGRIGVVTRQSGDNVVIEISDNGCGMPEDVQDKIFDPFYTTKEVGRGTGQGLSIAYDIIVNRHCGSLRVESAAGVGTSFLIELPITAGACDWCDQEQRAA